jgi:signal transduction histidine kinase
VASLAGYFGAYAQRFLELASVGCGLDIEEDLPDHPLDPRFRRELFLAFKEVLTNVIKHAEATKVWLGISIQDETLVVKVSDDGCGVLPDTREEGADGLVNMQERLAALGGHCEIRSDPEKGTTVCLKAPIQEVRI